MTSKILVAVGGLAAVVGISAGLAFAQQRGGGWERGYGHHDGQRWGHGRHGGHGRYGHYGRDLTLDEAMTRARARFARMDANSSGTIERSEIEARFDRRSDRWAGGRGGRRLGRMIRRWDADKDGRVTRQEFDSRVEDRFARFDLNSDGAITDADLPPFLRGRNVLSSNVAIAGGPGRGRWRGHRMGRRIAHLRNANTNTDDRVTTAEVMAEARQRFIRWDDNADGVIDRSDLDAFRAAMKDYRVKRVLHRFGAVEAGAVSRDVFMARAQQRFETRDLDNNGVLERGERRGRGWGRSWGRKGDQHGWGRGSRARHQGWSQGPYYGGRGDRRNSGHGRDDGGSRRGMMMPEDAGPRAMERSDTGNDPVRDADGARAEGAQ